MEKARCQEEKEWEVKKAGCKKELEEEVEEKEEEEERK